MKTEEIVDAARAAGFSASEMMTRLPAFKRLIDSAAATEREACAKIAEFTDLHEGDCLKNSDPRKTCADAIRARRNK